MHQDLTVFIFNQVVSLGDGGSENVTVLSGEGRTAH